MNSESSKLVIDFAKESIDCMRKYGFQWDKAYFRFESDELHRGASASYSNGNAVNILGALRYKDIFNKIEDFGRKLCESIMPKDKKQFVCLLTINSSFDYKIKFDFEDISKWRITKLDGGTGLPAGEE